METKTKRLYFASPFFNPEQVEREERLIGMLRDMGYEVWSPKENCYLPPEATQADQDLVFNQNCDGITGSDAVFAVTDGKDIGTIWEAGYAYGKDVPVIYYAETLPEGALFNLMLARSGKLIITEFPSTDEQRGKLADLIESVIVNGTSVPYEGLIE